MSLVFYEVISQKKGQWIEQILTHHVIENSCLSQDKSFLDWANNFDNNLFGNQGRIFKIRAGKMMADFDLCYLAST